MVPATIVVSQLSEILHKKCEKRLLKLFQTEVSFRT